MKILPLLCLLLPVAAIAPAQADPAPSPAAGPCLTLSSDQQIVRANADRDVLLRDGDQHYLVRFKNSCSSAARSPSLAFVTNGSEGTLCADGSSHLRTRSQRCDVAAVDTLTAQEFATRAKARSR